MPSPWLMREIRRAESLRAYHEERDQAMEGFYAWLEPGYRQRYRVHVMRQQDAIDVRDTYAAWRQLCD